MVSIRLLLYHIKCLAINPVSYIQNATLTNIESPKAAITVNSTEPYISVIILTHNALPYIKKCLTSLQQTNYSRFEIIVVDNASDPETRRYLREAKRLKLVDKVLFRRKNSFFAKGNNFGATHVSKKSTYLLLLNSDTEIQHPGWLRILVSNAPTRGVISWGHVSLPVFRPDGWCFLIDKGSFFEAGGLNERFPFNWSITDLTIKVLQKHEEVKVLLHSNEYILHFAGKSRELFSLKKALQTYPHMKVEEVIAGFGKRKIVKLIVP